MSDKCISHSDSPNDEKYHFGDSLASKNRIAGKLPGTQEYKAYKIQCSLDLMNTYFTQRLALTKPALPVGILDTRY